MNWLTYILAAALMAVFLYPAHANIQCGNRDDTATIQAAIDAAKTGSGVVQLPVGHCAIRSLDLTNIMSLVFKGHGPERTRLHPIEEGAVVLDLTGSRGIQLRDFQLGRATEPVTPAVGILTAQREGSLSSARHHFEDIYISGSYSVAAWYNLGAESSSVYSSQFYNYANGIGVVVFLSYNWPGVQSKFQQITTLPRPVTDWSFYQVEIHGMSQGSARKGGWSLWLGGTGEIRMFGGNISGHNVDGWVSFNRVAGYRNRTIMFIGTTFYSDFGTQTRCALNNTRYATNLQLMGNYYASANQLACR